MSLGSWLASAGKAILPALAGAAANTAGGVISTRRQYIMQKRLNAQQYAHDIEMMNMQNEYNSPVSQMARFKDAGLNPNLVYGQGTPGNMESPPKYPHQDAPDYGFLASIGTQIAQARLMNSQADLTKQKTDESGVKQDLMKAQTEVYKANPYLNKSYMDSFVSQMEAAANLKQQESTYFGIFQGKAIDKITLDLRLMEQRWKLNEADQKIKAEILESKEFQNYLNELTKKWIHDGGIDAQSIRYGTIILLNKFK